MPKAKVPAGKDASHLFTGYVDAPGRQTARRERAALAASGAAKRRHAQELKAKRTGPTVPPIQALLDLLYSPLKSQRMAGKNVLEGVYQLPGAKISPSHLLKMWHRHQVGLLSRKVPTMPSVPITLAFLSDVVGQAYLHGSLEGVNLTEQSLSFDVVNTPNLRVHFEVTFPHNVIAVSHQIHCSGKDQPLGLFKGFVDSLETTLKASVAAIDVGGCQARVLSRFQTHQEALAFEQHVLATVTPSSEFATAVQAVKAGSQATPTYWAFLDHQLQTNEDVLMFLTNN